MTKQKQFYLIRGLIREKGHWGHFIHHLEEAFPGSKITTIDIPGAGDYFKSPSPLSVSKMVEEMRRDYLKNRDPNLEPNLIAISLGGMITVEWLRKYPLDFARATLINTSFGGISPVHKRLMPKAFFHLLKVPVLKGRVKESRILELVTNHKEVFNETLDSWEVIQRERPVSTANTFKQLLAGACFNVGKFTPPVPLLIIASTKDRMVSVDCSRSIAKKWNLPIIEHPTGGHDLTVDDPKWVALKIKLFASN
ncbi:alpha/beta fold hydrolase [Peredibacter sp. HCB2-198]|uniref:alpha/beta fold hydrolase n=1 Tax=Peredibacter sp. HCB2-198 TaxID=3383025 RepID=UPI0038B617FB